MEGNALLDVCDEIGGSSSTQSETTTNHHAANTSTIHDSGGSNIQASSSSSSLGQAALASPSFDDGDNCRLVVPTKGGAAGMSTVDQGSSSSILIPTNSTTDLLKPSPVRTTASSILAPKIGNSILGMDTSSNITSSSNGNSLNSSSLVGSSNSNHHNHNSNNINRILPSLGFPSMMNTSMPPMPGFPMLPSSGTTPFPLPASSISSMSQTSMLQQPFPVQNSLIQSSSVSSNMTTNSKRKSNSPQITSKRKKMHQPYKSEKDNSDGDDNDESTGSSDQSDGDSGDESNKNSRGLVSSSTRPLTPLKQPDSSHVHHQENEEATRKTHPVSCLNHLSQSHRAFQGGSGSSGNLTLGIPPFPTPSNPPNNPFNTSPFLAPNSMSGSANMVSPSTTTSTTPLSRDHSNTLNLSVATQLQPMTTKSSHDDLSSKKKRKVRQASDTTANALQPSLTMSPSLMNSFLLFPPPRNHVDTTPSLTVTTTNNNNSNTISSPSTPLSSSTVMMNHFPTHHPNSGMFTTHAPTHSTNLSLAPSTALAPSSSNATTSTATNTSTHPIVIPSPSSLPPVLIASSSSHLSSPPLASSPDQKTHIRTTAESPTVIGPEKKASPGSTQISFKLWLKTLDTLSISKLKLVQEKVNQLLQEKESKKTPLAHATTLKEDHTISTDPMVIQTPVTTPGTNSQDSLIETNHDGVFEENDAAALLSSGGLSSIDTLLSVALADYSSQKDSKITPRSSKKFSIVTPPSPFLPPFPSSKSSTTPKMAIKSLTSDDDSDAGFSVESEALQIEGRQVEPFVREYKGHGYLYPGRRGLKSQQVKAPLCTFPGMRTTVLDIDKGGDSPTFIEGDDIVNPVIDLEHHLEFYIPDKDMTLYRNVRAYGLTLLKRVDRNCYIEESKILLARKPTNLSKSSSYSSENEYSLSIVAQEEKEYPADYSILLIETRGKKRNVNISEEDKISRYCEISHDYVTKQTKFRIGFRICKAQKKKHTKGIYMLRLVAFLHDDHPAVAGGTPSSSSSLFEPSSLQEFGIKKVLEESDTFKIVSRRSVVERTRINKRKKSTTNEDEDESPSSNP